MLSMLLCQHIIEKEPQTRVVWIDTWVRDRYIGLTWDSYLEQTTGVKAGDGSILIFDEAQATYWDTGLWSTFFKGILGSEVNNRAVVFTSRGSPTTDPLTQLPTPIFIPAYRQVTLRPIDHDDETQPAGLFLTKPEFDDFVALLFRDRHKFDVTFYNWVYNVTSGHAGASKDLIEIASAQEVRHLREMHLL
jgi:hypothetical protein